MVVSEPNFKNYQLCHESGFNYLCIAAFLLEDCIVLKKNEPLFKAQGLCESWDYSKSQSLEDKSFKYEYITDCAKLRDPGAQWEELYYI